jgi:hypothetical protein
MTIMATDTAQLLKSGFSCEDKEINDFMNTLDTNLNQHTSDYIRRLFRDINTNLLRRFNKDFKKDENGKNREWRDIEEPKIRELWQKIRANMLEVINEFKYIKLDRGILFNAIKNMRASEQNSPDNFFDQSRSPLAGSITRTLSTQYSRLLTEEDLNKVKDKFQEDTDFVLEEAIRKHHNVQATSVPWWIYALMAFFAADNVLSWLSSPIFFYPFIMIGGIISILFSMGLGPLIKPIFRQTANLILSRVGVDLRL